MIYQHADAERDKALAQRLPFTPGDIDPQPPNLTVVWVGGANIQVG
jgi:hypothetical protein